MKMNVGGIDRTLRIVVGIVLIALAATGTVGWWDYIGIVPLLIGETATCEIYTMLGMNTCAVQNKS